MGLAAAENASWASGSGADPCRRQPDQRDLRRGDSADGGYAGRRAVSKLPRRRLPKRPPEKGGCRKGRPREGREEKAYHGVLALVIGVCASCWHCTGIGFAGQVNAAKV